MCVCVCVCVCMYIWVSQAALVVKNLPANAGDERERDSIPGSWRSPGGGQGNPHQYSCLENPMDRGAWRATVHGVSKSRTWLSAKHSTTHTHFAFLAHSEIRWGKIWLDHAAQSLSFLPEKILKRGKGEKARRPPLTLPLSFQNPPPNAKDLPRPSLCPSRIPNPTSQDFLLKA